MRDIVYAIINVDQAQIVCRLASECREGRLTRC